MKIDGCATKSSRLAKAVRHITIIGIAFILMIIGMEYQVDAVPMPVQPLVPRMTLAWK